MTYEVHYEYMGRTAVGLIRTLPGRQRPTDQEFTRLVAISHGVRNTSLVKFISASEQA